MKRQLNADQSFPVTHTVNCPNSVHTRVRLSDKPMDDSLQDTRERITPSAKVKKKILKKVRRSKVNASLNSTLVKASLRSNNQALARALEIKKQEIAKLQQQVLQMKEREQELLLKVTTLERVAGLQNGQIEGEVDLRMEKRTEAVHLALQQVFAAQVKFVDGLTHAMEICGRPRRQSSVSHAKMVPARIGAATAGSRPNVAARLGPPRRIPQDQASANEDEDDDEDDDDKSVRVPSLPVSEKSSVPMITTESAPHDDIPSLPSASLLSVPASDVGPVYGNNQPFLPELVSAIPDLSIIAEASFFQDIPFTDDISHKHRKRGSSPYSIRESNESGRSSRSRSLRRSSVLMGRAPTPTPDDDGNITDDGVSNIESTQAFSRRTRTKSRGSLSRNSIATDHQADSADETQIPDKNIRPRHRSRSRTRTATDADIIDLIPAPPEPQHLKKPEIEGNAIISEPENVQPDILAMDPEEINEQQSTNKKSRSKNLKLRKSKRSKQKPLADSDDDNMNTEGSSLENTKSQTDLTKASDLSDDIEVSKKVDSESSNNKKNTKCSNEHSPNDLEKEHEMVVDKDTSTPQTEKGIIKSSRAKSMAFIPGFIPLEDSEQESSPKKTPPDSVLKEDTVSSRKKTKASDKNKKLKVLQAEEANNCEKEKSSKRLPFTDGLISTNNPVPQNEPTLVEDTPDPIEKRATRTRRGTFVMSKSPACGLLYTTQSENVATEKEIKPGKAQKDRRGTYCLPTKSLPTKSTPYADIEGLMDQDDSILGNISGGDISIALDPEIDCIPDSQDVPENQPDPPKTMSADFVFKVPDPPETVDDFDEMTEVYDLAQYGVIVPPSSKEIMEKRSIPEEAPQNPPDTPPNPPDNNEEVDMELTEVINFSQLKVPVPGFIQQMQKEEPSFLQNLSDESPGKSPGKKESSQKSSQFISPKKQNTAKDSTVIVKPLGGFDDDVFKKPIGEAIKIKKPHAKSKLKLPKSRLPIARSGRSGSASASDDEVPTGTSNGKKKETKSVGDKSQKNERKSRSRKRVQTLNITDEEESENEQKERETVESEPAKTENSNGESESEKISKKFNTFLVKPGKITFTGGRRNVQDLIKNHVGGRSRSKSKSTLPMVSKSRSKSRSKTRRLSSQEDLKMLATEPDSVFNFKSREKKNTFDISLSDSIIVDGQKPSYSAFCGRDAPQINPEVAAQLAKEKESYENMVLGNGACGVSESPHGIMLVLGNGKRTKPRAPRRSKSVRYARRLTQTKFTTPAPATSPGSEQDNATPPPSDDIKPMAEDAGNTPVRRSREHVTASDDIPAFCVPESPFPVQSKAKPDVLIVGLQSVSDSLSGSGPEQNCASVGESPVAPNQKKRSRQLLSSTEDSDAEVFCPSPSPKRAKDSHQQIILSDSTESTGSDSGSSMTKRRPLSLHGPSKSSRQLSQVDHSESSQNDTNESSDNELPPKRPHKKSNSERAPSKKLHKRSNTETTSSISTPPDIDSLEMAASKSKDKKKAKHKGDGQQGDNKLRKLKEKLRQEENERRERKKQERLVKESASSGRREKEIVEDIRNKKDQERREEKHRENEDREKRKLEKEEIKRREMELKKKQQEKREKEILEKERLEKERQEKIEMEKKIQEREQIRKEIEEKERREKEQLEKEKHDRMKKKEEAERERKRKEKDEQERKMKAKKEQEKSRETANGLIVVKQEPLSPVSTDMSETHDKTKSTEKLPVPDFEMKTRDSCEPDGADMPRRRRGNVVSYKEPSLGGKLRRGDAHTSTIYNRDDVPELKKPKEGCKKSTDNRKRSALSTVTNTLDSDDNA